MSAIGDYYKKGGLLGYCAEMLKLELEKAKTQPDHPFHTVIQSNPFDSQKLYEICIDISNDKHHPVFEVAEHVVFLAKRASVKPAIKYLADLVLNNRPLPNDTPKELEQWALLEAGTRLQQKSNAQKNRKHKQLDAIKNAIKNYQEKGYQTFDYFFADLIEQNVDGLEIEHISNKKYGIYIEDFTIPKTVTKNTIRGWYTQVNKARKVPKSRID